MGKQSLFRFFEACRCSKEMLLTNREAFAKGKKGKRKKKRDFRGMKELACDLIRDKDENCKCLKALRRSIPGVLF